MSFTRYRAIYQWWYMACTHLYIRHTPCTCRICGIGPYSTGDTWPVHFYTSDIHPVHVVYAVLGHIQPVIHSLYTFIHQTFTLHMSYTRYWAIFNRWYIPVHFYTSDIHPVHVINAVLGHIQPLIHSLYTFIHQTFTLYMSYTQYWAIFNRWYIPCALLYIRHTPCTCRIRSIGPYSTRWYIACTLLYIRHTPCTCRIRGIGKYSTGDTWRIHFYTSDIHPVHVVYALLGHIQPVIHGLYTFIHQTYTLNMSYTRYWAIFNRWYMALLYQTYTLYMWYIGPYSTIDT